MAPRVRSEPPARLPNSRVGPGRVKKRAGVRVLARTWYETSRFIEQSAKHVATPNMEPSLLTQVGEHSLVVASCILQGVGQYGKASVVQRPARQLPLFAGGLGELDHQTFSPGQPRGVEDGR